MKRRFINRDISTNKQHYINNSLSRGQVENSLNCDHGVLSSVKKKLCWMFLDIYVWILCTYSTVYLAQKPDILSCSGRDRLVFYEEIQIIFGPVKENPTTWCWKWKTYALSPASTSKSFRIVTQSLYGERMFEA